MRLRLPRPKTLPQWLLAGVIVFYAGWFSYWTVRNHDGFGTFGYDLGIFDQGIWLLSRFHAPFVTFMGRNLFGDHTSFILLPFVPLYWIYPSAHLLLIAQSLACALTAIPVFLIARRRLDDEWLALILGVAVLLQPALQLTNFENFHPDAFEFPLMALVLLFMLDERWTPYFISIALLMSVKEDTPLVVFAVGVYVAIRKNRKIGLITCAAATGYFFLAIYGILRTLNGIGSMTGYRIPFGGYGGVLRTAFGHPIRFLHYLGSDHRIWYLWQLVAPLAVLPLLGLDLAVLAIGPVLVNLISDFPYQHEIGYHYATSIVPIFAVATVIGISRLRGEFPRYLAVGTVAFASLASAWLWGPTPWARNPEPIANPSAVNISYVEKAIAVIPKDASVSSWYGYAVHLDHRREIYDFPVPWVAQYWGDLKHEGERLPQADHIDYVIIPPDAGGDPVNQRVLAEIRPDYTEVYSSPYVIVLKHDTR